MEGGKSFVIKTFSIVGQINLWPEQKSMTYFTGEIILFRPAESINQCRIVSSPQVLHIHVDPEETLATSVASDVGRPARGPNPLPTFVTEGLIYTAAEGSVIGVALDRNLLADRDISKLHSQ